MKRYFLYDPKAKKYGMCFVKKQDAEKNRTQWLQRSKQKYEQWGKSKYKYFAEQAKQNLAYWNRVVIREFDMKCVAEY